MKDRKNLALTVFASCVLFLSNIVYAESGPITVIKIKETGAQLEISWSALGKNWDVTVTKATYLADNTPIISVEVDTGNESLLENIFNCYYTGTQTGSSDVHTTVYVKRCEGDATFTGFVASSDPVDGDVLYGIDGATMSLLETGDTGGSVDDTGGGDNGKRTKGASNDDPILYEARRGDATLFPSLEVIVEPSYINAVGTDNYIDRIMENLALANMIYERSLIKPIKLIAILVLDKDITTSDSQGNILGAVEKLRKHNIQANSGDISMFLTGKEFSQPYLWGWAEGGYACELQQAVAEVDNLNTHTIGKSAGVMRDLPSLMQRGWILAHEVGHSLGGGHWADDPLMDGGFQPALSLQDYSTRCEVLESMLETCAYDPKNKKFIDYYVNECP